MQTIMFDHRRFELEQAVLMWIKTMTRRTVKLPDELKASDVWNPVIGIDQKGKVYFTVDCIDGQERDLYPQYQVGEVVAVAQKYSELYKKREIFFQDKKSLELYKSTGGWNNKMFVRADLMLHRIKITNIKLERLQDISDEDCHKEGIVYVQWKQWLKQDVDDFKPQPYKLWDVWTVPKFRESLNDSWGEQDPDEFMAESPKVAFYVIIRKLMGKKVWNTNPWVWVYEFELVR